jgi:hypothetical protein
LSVAELSGDRVGLPGEEGSVLPATSAQAHALGLIRLAKVMLGDQGAAGGRAVPADAR